MVPLSVVFNNYSISGCYEAFCFGERYFWIINNVIATVATIIQGKRIAVRYSKKKSSTNELAVKIIVTIQFNKIGLNSFTIKF